MAVSDNFLEMLSNPLENTVYSMSKPSFYAELLVVIGIIALAWAVSLFVRRRINSPEASTSQRIWRELLLKSLVLLTPVLAIIGLSFAQPFAREYTDSSVWVITTIYLIVAYLIARLVLLLIKSRVVAYFIVSILLLLTVLNITGYAAPAKDALESIAFSIGEVKVTLLGIVQGIIILVALFWLAGRMSNALETALRKNSSLDYNMRELASKLFTVLIYTIATLMALSAVGIDLTALAIFGGALGVGIGLGLQQITSNFISGITLLMEKSVKMGDLVEVNESFGWVKEMNIRYTLIETYEGRELIIPNEQLINTQVTNWTHTNAHARIEFTVGVAYGSDVDMVMQLILEALQEHERCIKEPAPACYLREFGDSSINFLVQFWVENVRDGRYGPQSDVMRVIMRKFKANGIEIPFPQRVVHMAQPQLTES